MVTTRIGIIGGGWRADFFARLAQQIPEHFELVGMASRSAATMDRLRDAYGVNVYRSATDLIGHENPDLLVVSVAASATPGIIEEAAALGTHVLTETPPAQTVDDLRDLWQKVGPSGLVQVAEQYLLLPSHASRKEVVGRGLIGIPTSVQVSSTHGYHAVSIIRGILGAGFEPVTVRGSTRAAPLLDPINRAGFVPDPQVIQAGNILATLDFPCGMGLYDFTDNQWHNQLRHRRIVIRGSLGELVDDSVVRLSGPNTILESPLTRGQLGYDLNLDGYDTEHVSFEGSVVYRNPFLGHRLMDEEIAIAAIMRDAGLWARGEHPGPYPLADGMQDQLLALAIAEAVATGQRVQTAVESWAGSGSGQ